MQFIFSIFSYYVPNLAESLEASGKHCTPLNFHCNYNDVVVASSRELTSLGADLVVKTTEAAAKLVRICNSRNLEHVTGILLYILSCKI
jgi:hypothetical protein